MQHQITERKALLDEEGKLTEAGYATSLVLDYDRNAIKGGSTRIKEWDYYLITDGKIGVALTIADNSYMGLDSISFLDFENAWEKTVSPMKIFPMGKTGFPPTSERGDVTSSNKKYLIDFKNDGTKRVLTFKLENFHEGESIRGEIVLDNPPKGGSDSGECSDTMVIATPFPGKETAFY